MNRFKELKFWQKAMDLAEIIYRETEVLPDTEKFGLLVQTRKCAVSIPSNIAEGAGRNSKGEFRNFLGIASGSASELQTQIELCRRFNYLSCDPAKKVDDTIEEIQKMIYSLIQSLK